MMILALLIPQISFASQIDQHKHHNKNHHCCDIPRHDKNFRQIGIASWYGPRFHGYKTSSGEIFNQNKLTAAHMTLPFGTLVRITNLKNKKFVIVRINDRGGFIKYKRILDMSQASAKKIGLTGIGKVLIEIIA
jgi:rare lipoprotein A